MLKTQTLYLELNQQDLKLSSHEFTFQKDPALEESYLAALRIAKRKNHKHRRNPGETMCRGNDRVILW
jgi:hypothetical protein